MSDIKFIQQFGDELNRAITTDAAHQGPAKHETFWTRLRRLIRNHRPLAIILVAVTVAGCATAVALSVNKRDTRTVAYGVACYSSSPKYHRQAYTPIIIVNGKRWGGTYLGTDLTQLCANEFAGTTADQYVVCVSPNNGINVYEKVGTTDECASHREVSYTKRYQVAVLNVVQLDAALQAADYSRDCWSRPALLAQITKILAAHGFHGWKATVTSHDGAPAGGDCFELVALPNIAPPSSEGSELLIDPTTDSVLIWQGPPRLVLAAAERYQMDAFDLSWYATRRNPATPARLVALFHRDFAMVPQATGWRVEFQLYDSSGDRYAHFSQEQYEHYSFYAGNWGFGENHTFLLVGSISSEPEHSLP